MSLYQAPYFDDYLREGDDNLTPQDKNFLRVLYRPGFAVQARELNTTQSILLNQISLLITSIWPDKTLIRGSRTDNYRILNTGAIDIEWEHPLWKIDGSDTDAIKESKINSVISYFARKKDDIQIEESPRSSLPEVELNIEPLEVENRYRIYFIDNTNANTGDKISSSTRDIDPITNELRVLEDEAIAEIIDVHKSIRYSLDENNNSIYASLGFLISTRSTKNRFVRFVAPNTTFARKIVLSPVLDIIRETDDKSLLDNAAGSPNWNAPGAHRQSIVFELNIRNDEDSPSELEDTDIVLKTIDQSTATDTEVFNEPATTIVT